MSSYVERILQPGEQVRHVATLHWILYVPGFLVLIVSLAVLSFARSVERGEGFWLAVSAVLAAVAIIWIFQAWFKRWITEIAVTDRRVIYKTGFIRRDTNEMQMDKVESVRVDQPILGRLLDYGDVSVLGTGKGEFARLKTIAEPLELRNQITGR
ncbi:MAG: PH domain-containing protein [Rhizobiales bacterium]|nr:PH domain-containing protein [Hyphomicrobiales bacterium]